MLYLISQMLFSLILAGLLGAAIAGWYQHARSAARLTELRRVIQKQQRMVAQADNDVHMVNEDYDELKRQSLDEITRLREENRQIAVLEHNLEKSQLLVRQLLQKQGHQVTPPPTTLIPPVQSRQVADPDGAQADTTSVPAPTPPVSTDAAAKSAPNRPEIARTAARPAPTHPDTADAAANPARRRRSGGLESRVAKGRYRKPSGAVPTPVPDERDESLTTATTRDHLSFVPPAAASRTLPTTALPVSGHANSLATSDASQTLTDGGPGELGNAIGGTRTPVIPSPDAAAKSGPVAARPAPASPAMVTHDMPPDTAADRPAVQGASKPESRPARRGWGSAPVTDINVEPPSADADESEAPGSNLDTPVAQASEAPGADAFDENTPDTVARDSQAMDTASRSSGIDSSVGDAFAEDSWEPSPSEASLATTAPSDPERLYEPVEPSDDLQQIVGIGPLTEQGLNRLGITTYSQLAHLDSQDIEKIAEALEIGPGRIVAYDWVGSARQQLEDVLEEL